jgi:hypothetical protein
MVKEHSADVDATLQAQRQDLEVRRVDASATATTSPIILTNLPDSTDGLYFIVQPSRYGRLPSADKRLQLCIVWLSYVQEQVRVGNERGDGLAAKNTSLEVRCLLASLLAVPQYPGRWPVLRRCQKPVLNLLLRTVLMSPVCECCSWSGHVTT